MEEMTVYKFWHDESCIIGQTLKEISVWIEAEAEYYFESEESQFELSIEKTTMTVDEFENLPEFDGFN